MDWKFHGNQTRRPSEQLRNHKKTLVMYWSILQGLTAAHEHKTAAALNFKFRHVTAVVVVAQHRSRSGRGCARLATACMSIRDYQRRRDYNKSGRDDKSGSSNKIRRDEKTADSRNGAGISCFRRLVKRRRYLEASGDYIPP